MKWFQSTSFWFQFVTICGKYRGWRWKGQYSSWQKHPRIHFCYWISLLFDISSSYVTCHRYVIFFICHLSSDCLDSNGSFGWVVCLANAELKLPQRQFFARCLLPTWRPCLPIHDHCSGPYVESWKPETWWKWLAPGPAVWTPFM